MPLLNNNNNNTLIYIAPACRMTSEALADSWELLQYWNIFNFLYKMACTSSVFSGSLVI